MDVSTSNEKLIKEYILRNYDSSIRPVKNISQTMDIKVAMSLYHILDTNEKEQTYTTLLAIRMKWFDEYFVWNNTEYKNIKEINIPQKFAWKPDIVVSNFAGGNFGQSYETTLIINSNGWVLWMYPIKVKTYCTYDVYRFPFDLQSCNITLISWTHNGYQLNLSYSEEFPNSIYYRNEYNEWAVTSIKTTRNVLYYACCKEPYPDVTFTIEMKRGSMFYIFYFIMPCLLFYFITIFGFFVPANSGEKITIEITVFLSIVILLLMVSEEMPPVSEYIPVLGMLFGATMALSALAVFMSVVTSMLYGLHVSTYEPPIWLYDYSIIVYLIWNSWYSRRKLKDLKASFKFKENRIDGDSTITRLNSCISDRLTTQRKVSEHIHEETKDNLSERFYDRTIFHSFTLSRKWILISSSVNWTLFCIFVVFSVLVYVIITSLWFI
ncbi:Acetylcholine receptor-like protein cup-4 [Intoshia linei]|uniref:Acetylcholine receptor-like protein cup-4 n=1 Tax=Intoshia linei TaxID=1819745 RepID=A0A177B284_9BILA|nr:Acetylcholine receptor-like protein cup-4 [Intoshia linei]